MRGRETASARHLDVRLDSHPLEVPARHRVDAAGVRDVGLEAAMEHVARSAVRAAAGALPDDRRAAEVLQAVGESLPRGERVPVDEDEQRDVRKTAAGELLLRPALDGPVPDAHEVVVQVHRLGPEEVARQEPDQASATAGVSSQIDQDRIGVGEDAHRRRGRPTGVGVPLVHREVAEPQVADVPVEDLDVAEAVVRGPAVRGPVVVALAGIARLLELGNDPHREVSVVVDGPQVLGEPAGEDLGVGRVGIGPLREVRLQPRGDPLADVGKDVGASQDARELPHDGPALLVRDGARVVLPGSAREREREEQGHQPEREQESTGGSAVRAGATGDAREVRHDRKLGPVARAE